MFDQLPRPRLDGYRDILSETDAGELDEQYLIKHASDYGKQSTWHPFRTLKAIVTRLLKSMRRSSPPQTIEQPVKSFSRSTTG